jgi:serine/threonine protein kinase
MSEIMPYKTGDIVDGKYRILEFLGEGGLAYNYVVRSVNDGAKKIVLKQTKRRMTINGQISEDHFQMEREFRTLLELNNQSIPKAYDIFERDGILYFTREFRIGRSLEDLINDGMNKELIQKVCHQILNILQYLHGQNLIYRDLKPSNILVDEHNKVFLFDFGTSRRYKPGKEKDTIALGTPGFAAPEQYGKAQTDCRADIYSFGALLYYILTQDNPEDNAFMIGEQENIRHWNFNPGIKLVLEKCLALNPDYRYSNVSSLRKDFFNSFALCKLNYRAGMHQKFPDMATFEFLAHFDPVEMLTESTIGLFLLSLPVIIIQSLVPTIAPIHLQLFALAIIVLFVRSFVKGYGVNSKRFFVKHLFSIEEYPWDNVVKLSRIKETHYVTAELDNGKEICISGDDIDKICHRLMAESGIVIEELVDNQSPDMKVYWG